LAKDNKTEKATPQKIRKAREEGNIAKSKDLNNTFTLLALAAVLLFWGDGLAMEISNSFSILLSSIDISTDPKKFFLLMGSLLLKILVPIVILVYAFHILNYLVQVRFLFSAKIIKPKPSRINPKNYFTHLFSRKSLVDLAKSLLYTGLLGYAAYLVLRRGIEGYIATIGSNWTDSLREVFEGTKSVFLIILIISLVIGVVDYIYQRWEHSQNLMMKKEEVKQEHKDNEGSPEVKHKQKSFMYAIVQGAMAKKMDDATFVLNNPTHLSVALRYRKNEDAAPVVLAKGEDELAMYMRQLAKENKIPMVENKQLARALYYNVEEGDIIPEDLYVTVIEVMRYLIQTKQIEI